MYLLSKVMKFMVFYKRYENHHVDDITMNPEATFHVPRMIMLVVEMMMMVGGDDPFRVCVDPAVHM